MTTRQRHRTITRGTPIPDWDKTLAELDHWIRTHGTARVRQSDVGRRNCQGEPYPLGSKLKVIRQRYRRGTLDPIYIEELEAKQGWAWHVKRSPGSQTPDTVPQAWSDKYRELVTYFDKHGPTATPPEDLYNWIQRQRREHRAGRLSQQQQQLLAKTPGSLEGRYGASKTRRFAAALTAWLAEDTNRTLASIDRNTRIPDSDGGTIPALKRILYYRARRSGSEGVNPLTPDEVEALQSIPGWHW